MPQYEKKITELMDYRRFAKAIVGLSDRQQAFLTMLFFAGCRVSEALALTSKDINCTPEIIFVQFFRLKGSKQTDPQELPRAGALTWLCGHEGILFPFSRRTSSPLGKESISELVPSLLPNEQNNKDGHALQ